MIRYNHFIPGSILMVHGGFLGICLWIESNLGLSIFIWSAGWLWWTLSEYVVNRWFYHLQKKPSIILQPIVRHHELHHRYPDQIRFNIMHPWLVLLLICLAAAPATLSLPLPFLLGFISGYISFTLLHVYEHKFISPNFLFKGIWEAHFLHHNGYSEAGFGVSTRLWDYVFNTLPPRHVFFRIDPSASKAIHQEPSVLTVCDHYTEELFAKIPQSINRQDRNYIPAIESEISGVFDPLINPFFSHGAASRWIIVSPSGEVLGRVAAFINFKKKDEEKQVVAGIGFFECVNDKTTAFLLFDTAVKWLKESHHVTAVDAPINFGENDKYWGLLVAGFSPPSYGMNYNPPYYRDLFEAYGFQIKFKQLTNSLSLSEPLPPRFSKIAMRVLANNCYSFKPFEYRNKDHFIKDFLFIYNRAWASFSNFQPMTEDTIRMTLNEIKFIVEEEFIWFGYEGSKPAGFVFMVPDVNGILRYSGGNLNWLGKLKLLYWKRKKGFTRLRVVVMGVIPECQNRGLESALIYCAHQVAMKMPNYTEVELSWVGDFNHKMIAIHKGLGAKEIKQHATFRKQV